MNKEAARSYKDLIVWQKGIEAAKLVYHLTAGFPAEEKFGIISQMRRAAVSVPSNIAEGPGATYHRRIHSIHLSRRGFCRRVEHAANPVCRTRLLFLPKVVLLGRASR